MSDELIEQFFKKKLITADNTKRSYKSNIHKYFIIINKDIDTYFDKSKPLDKFENNLLLSFEKLHEKASPLSLRTFYNSIKQFMCTMDKRLKTLDFWDTIKGNTRGSSSISIEDVPNTKDLKTILQHGNTLSRALFLILASSGARISEVLALTKEDINTNKKPTTIYIGKQYDRKSPNKVKNQTKTKKNRICFISDEATESYIAWLKERDNYFKASLLKSKYEKNPNDTRVFPMSDENARTIWENLVRKSGLLKKDRVTKRLSLHPHVLRKFFRSYLGNSDLAEHLMGHATGMDKHYRNKKPEDLAQDYNMLMQNVTIFNRVDLSGINQEMIDLKDENEKLKEMMQEMKAQITEMRLERLEKENGIVKEKK